MSSILHGLSSYVRDLRERGLPDEVRHAAARCVIDWFAATVPGGLQPPATVLSAALSREHGGGEAALIPTGQWTSARVAALINGCAAHTIEFDDIYRDALYHPGAPTIAAAMAAAQARGASGELFLRAVIAGYELSTRIGVVVNPSHYNFWHTTGTVGTFGSAAAAATVFRLDAAAIGHALATAGTLAAGLQQAFRSHSMSKPLHAGHAAETGVLAALGAAHGLTGTADILEGPRGFGAAMSNAPDFTRALGDLHRFNICQMTVKNYAACGHTHAAIDAARRLRSATDLAIGDVARIEIATYAKALEVAGNPAPRTAFEAQFSLPYCVAVALQTGSARMAAFSEEQLADAALRSLMTRVHLSVDPQADAVYPQQRAATVTLHLRSGAVRAEHAPTRKGDPDNPLSDEELSDKFIELVAPVIGDAPARTFLATLWRIASVDDLSALRVPSPVPVAVGGRV